jgi:hypothetical protein
LIKFKEGKRVEYIDNLAPGVYVLVRMTAHIYPHSGLGHIQEDDFWDDYL